MFCMYVIEKKIFKSPLTFRVTCGRVKYSYITLIFKYWISLDDTLRQTVNALIDPQGGGALFFRLTSGGWGLK